MHITHDVSFLSHRRLTRGRSPRREQGVERMAREQIQEWLRYWQAAKMVAVDQILAFDQVSDARRYCSCMRVGVFTPDQVTDLQIWRALTAMREADAAKRPVA